MSRHILKVLCGVVLTVFGAGLILGFVAGRASAHEVTGDRGGTKDESPLTKLKAANACETIGAVSAKYRVDERAARRPATALPP